jgi:2-isopropylmalate synthase
MSPSTLTQNAPHRARIHVLDTTLRDGEQAPGFSMSASEKLVIAQVLARLKVDTIEAGFAAASPGDAEAVRLIASEITGPTLCSLARATCHDVDAAARALEPAHHKRLHIFLATSPIHREAKLQMSRDEVLRAIETSLEHARGQFDEIEFSAEDALRTEPDFLVEAMNCAAAHGADVLNVPDTVGVSEPGEIRAVFERLDREVERSEHVIFSAHCHNDLGLAVSNSLAAIQGGARQIECSINGIGERAGNCSLEEVVMALNVRADIFGYETCLDTTQLWPASQALTRVTGAALSPNKAIVGENAFAHEAGIHQHGMMTDRRTYEIMTPESVGSPGSALVLGKHSGRHALGERLASLGYKLDAPALAAACDAFKTFADEHGEVLDADLVALMETRPEGRCPWSVVRTELRTTTGPRAKQFARVELHHTERGRIADVATGDGPLSAIFAAVRRITDADADVLGLETRLLRSGETREFIAEIQLDLAGHHVRGRARGPDVITASIDAFLFTLDHHQASVPARSQAPKQTAEPA